MISLLLACQVATVSHPYNDPEGWTLTVDPCGFAFVLFVATVLGSGRTK